MLYLMGYLGRVENPKRTMMSAPSAKLSSSGFPVDVGGVGELHAAFFTESRTRGHIQSRVAGNPGLGGVDFERENQSIHHGTQ
jgi:hypothetical protein